MDLQTYSAIAFVLVLALVLYIKRKKLAKQKIFYPFLYVIMYRTKIGLKLMDRAAKRFPRFLKYMGYAAVFIGFIGMGMICYSLIENLVKLMVVPQAASAVALVLPFKVKGAFFVPFFYWIISIFFLVIVHEFFHGVISRLYGIKIKSSGLAFFCILLPIVPAAFVEPDEKKLAKKPRVQQLSVFAAGSFSNIIFAFIFLAVLLIAMNPIMNSIIEYDGVQVSGLIKKDNMTFPAEKAGMKSGDIITRIDNMDTLNVENLSDYLSAKKPGDLVTITANSTEYSFRLSENPDNKSLPYMGIYLMQHSRIRPSFEQLAGSFVPNSMIWISGLVIWLFILNLGIGLFNLVPIPITDGGRMMYIALLHYFDEKKAKRIWKGIALFFVMLIIVNIIFGFFR